MSSISFLEKVMGKKRWLLTMVTDPEDRVFGLSELLPLPALLSPELLVLVPSTLHKLQVLPVGDHELRGFKGRHSTTQYTHNDHKLSCFEHNTLNLEASNAGTLQHNTLTMIINLVALNTIHKT